MRHLHLGPMVFGALVIAAPFGSAQACGEEPGDSEAVVATRADIDTSCNCKEAPTRSAYVRCAHHVVRAHFTAGGLRSNCVAAVTRCAKRSTCGRPGFVTCCRQFATGSHTCTIRPSADSCRVPPGGTACVGSYPSCCDACSGAACTSAMPNDEPEITFTAAQCPSVFAPATCASGVAETCHESFVTGGSSACLTGHGGHVTFFSPDDGVTDGGTSRAWSFAVRPQGRTFYSVYPEVTGSVRATSDGRGAAGTGIGASAAAHIRLRTGQPVARLLALRWFTDGLPAAAQGRLRLVAGSSVLFDAIEGPGPPTNGLRLLHVPWNGTLDLTMSGAIGASRDQTADSANLMWHLAILRPRDDDDADGVPNQVDPDPFDSAVPGPRPVSIRPKVLVIGLDGAGWDVLGTLVGGGFLPTLEGMIANGARASLDASTADPAFCCFCPAVWTSIATGRRLPDHRMGAIESEPQDRPVPAIWQVLSRYGGRVTQVNYRNTFPAEPGVSYSLAEHGSLRAAASVYVLKGIAPDPRSESENVLQGTWPPLLYERLGILPQTPALPAWFPFGEDRVGGQGLRELLRTEQTDLTVWILHSVDKSEHLSWYSVQPTPADPFDPSAVLNQAAQWTGPLYQEFGWGDVASNYLEDDQVLGQLLATRQYDYVVVLSDHAMTRVNGPFSGHHFTPPAFHGIFILSGPGVQPLTDLGTASVLDVAPTLAYLLDLPVAQDLPGHVLTAAFTLEHLAAKPVRTVPNW